MGKRTAVILLVILLAGLTLIGYFFHQGRKSLLTDPYKAIAPDACFIIETADIQSLFNALTTGKGIFSEIGKIDEFRNFDTKLKYVADQLNKPGFQKLIQEGKTLISFHPSKRKLPAPFVSMTIPADAGFRQVRETAGQPIAPIYRHGWRWGRRFEVEPLRPGHRSQHFQAHTVRTDERFREFLQSEAGYWPYLGQFRVEHQSLVVQEHQPAVAATLSVLEKILFRGRVVPAPANWPLAPDGGMPADLAQLRYGVSVTDACIDWATTADLLRRAAAELRPALAARASR